MKKNNLVKSSQFVTRNIVPLKCDCFQILCKKLAPSQYWCREGSMHRKQFPLEIPMELISLSFTALYFRGGRTLFTTRLSSSINHKSISQNSLSRFISSSSSCLPFSFWLSFSSVTFLSISSFTEYKTYETRAITRQCERSNSEERHRYVRLQKLFWYFTFSAGHVPK